MPSSAVQTCALDRKSTRLNSSHTIISYAVFCLQKDAVVEHRLRSGGAVSPPVSPRGRPRGGAEVGRGWLRAVVIVQFFFFMFGPPPIPPLFPPPPHRL